MVDHFEAVLRCILEIHELHQCCAAAALLHIFYLYSVLHIVHQRFVALLQCSLVHGGHQTPCIVEHRLRCRRIQLPQCSFQLCHIARLAIITFHLIATLIVVAKVLEQRYQRLLKFILCESVVGHISLLARNNMNSRYPS